MRLKKTCTIFCLILCIHACAQQGVDTVITNDVYSSYFNYTLHEPLYVVYKLYKGGGDCSRQKFKFNSGDAPNTATSKDYEGKGYDQGHLVNAEDFAFDCKKEEETFRFYNCVPQTVRLNRGIWKHWETEIRNESGNDSLLIVCGSIFGNKTIGSDHIAVPDYCWKVVYSLTTHNMLYCMLFPNDNSDTYKDLNVEELKTKLGYELGYEPGY